MVASSARAFVVWLATCAGATVFTPESAPTLSRCHREPSASSAERNNGSNVMVGLVPPVMVTPTNTVSHPKQLTLLDGGILASVSVAESAAIADAPVRTVLIVPATPRATAISPPYRRLRGTRSGW